MTGLWEERRDVGEAGGGEMMGEGEGEVGEGEEGELAVQEGRVSTKKMMITENK